MPTDAQILLALPINTLRSMAKRQGVSAGGSKADIVERLLCVEEDEDEDEEESEKVESDDESNSNDVGVDKESTIFTEVLSPIPYSAKHAHESSEKPAKTGNPDPFTDNGNTDALGKFKDNLLEGREESESHIENHIFSDTQSPLPSLAKSQGDIAPQYQPNIKTTSPVTSEVSRPSSKSPRKSLVSEEHLPKTLPTTPSSVFEASVLTPQHAHIDARIGTSSTSSNSPPISPDVMPSSNATPFTPPPPPPPALELETESNSASEVELEPEVESEPEADWLTLSENLDQRPQVALRLSTVLPEFEASQSNLNDDNHAHNTKVDAESEEEGTSEDNEDWCAYGDQKGSADHTAMLNHLLELEAEFNAMILPSTAFSTKPASLAERDTRHSPDVEDGSYRPKEDRNSSGKIRQSNTDQALKHNSSMIRRKLAQLRKHLGVMADLGLPAQRHGPVPRFESAESSALSGIVSLVVGLTTGAKLRHKRDDTITEDMPASAPLPWTPVRHSPPLTAATRTPTAANRASPLSKQATRTHATMGRNSDMGKIEGNLSNDITRNQNDEMPGKLVLEIALDAQIYESPPLSPPSPPRLSSPNSQHMGYLSKSSAELKNFSDSRGKQSAGSGGTRQSSLGPSTRVPAGSSSIRGGTQANGKSTHTTSNHLATNVLHKHVPKPASPLTKPAQHRALSSPQSPSTSVSPPSIVMKHTPPALVSKPSAPAPAVLPVPAPTPAVAPTVVPVPAPAPAVLPVPAPAPIVVPARAVVPAVPAPAPAPAVLHAAAPAEVVIPSRSSVNTKSFTSQNVGSGAKGKVIASTNQESSHGLTSGTNSAGPRLSRDRVQNATDRAVGVAAAKPAALGVTIPAADRLSHLGVPSDIRVSMGSSRGSGGGGASAPGAKGRLSSFGSTGNKSSATASTTLARSKVGASSTHAISLSRTSSSSGSYPVSAAGKGPERVVASSSVNTSTGRVASGATVQQLRVPPQAASNPFGQLL